MSTATLHSEKKKTLFPQLRFQEFDGEWKNTNLGEAFTIFNGYAFASSSSVEDGVLWVKIAEVGIQEMKKNNLSYLPISLKEKHKKFILTKGDFVVALTRPILNGKLKIAQINSFFDGALLNQRVGKIISSNSHYFIYSLLQKDELIKSIENNIAGSDPPNLSPNEINSIKISYPTLPEQQKIASFLSAVDEKIQQLSRKKELLSQYKKGVMQQLFSGKLRFKDENGKDYADWEEKKLGDLVKIKSGNSPSDYQFVNEGVNPFIKVEELNNCSKYQNKSRFYSNDNKNLIETKSVIFPKRGAAILNNKVRINDCPILMDSNMMALIPLRKELNVEFLYSKIVMAELYKIADTSSIPQINNKHIEPYVISTPCLEEQQKIANFLSSIDAKIESTSQQINRTQNFKKGLLQQMFV
jgi:type I restriction enzyme S subunit